MKGTNDKTTENKTTQTTKLTEGTTGTKVSVTVKMTMKAEPVTTGHTVLATKAAKKKKNKPKSALTTKAAKKEKIKPKSALTTKAAKKEKIKQKSVSTTKAAIKKKMNAKLSPPILIIAGGLSKGRETTFLDEVMALDLNGDNIKCNLPPLMVDLYSLLLH